MPQGPIATQISAVTSGVTKTLTAAPGGALQVTQDSAVSTALNVGAAAVIKATPGRICKIIVVTAPTVSGALTINDCATTGAAATANQVYSIGYAAATAGLVISLDFPCLVGIVVSAVGGTPGQFSISYS